MKKITITIAFALVASVSAFAQESKPSQPVAEKPVVVMLTPSQITLTQQIFKFTYDALLTSESPSRDVQQARKAIEGLFPFFKEQVTVTNSSDSTKRATPIKK